jgi:hypothetical protein
VGDTLLLDLDRAAVAELVGRLAADLGRGRLPHGMPYRHVNGFTKIVAAEYGDGSRLTLHYWPAAPGAGEHVSRPHDHRFPFSSVLLGGHQRFIELSEVPGRGWRRCTYRPYWGGRIAHVRHIGNVSLQSDHEVTREPLQGHYATTTDVVHQAVTDRRAACATLVLRGPRERLTSRVYYRPDEPVPRGGLQLGRRLAPDEVIRQLNDVLGMVRC